MQFAILHTPTQHYRVLPVQNHLAFSQAKHCPLGTDLFLGKTSEKTERAFLDSQKIVRASSSVLHQT